MLPQRGQIVLPDGSFDLGLDLGRDDLEPAHEDAHDLGGARFDFERQDGIDGGTRDQVEEPRPFLEPRIPPGLDHRGGFAGIQTLLYQRRLQILAKVFEVACERRPLPASPASDCRAPRDSPAVPPRFSKRTKSPISSAPVFSTAMVPSCFTRAETGTGKLARPR